MQQLLTLLLGALSLGDVSDRAREHGRFGAVDARDGQLDGKLAGVGAHGRQLHAPADQTGLSGLHHAPQSGAMGVAELGWDRQRGQLEPIASRPGSDIASAAGLNS